MIEFLLDPVFITAVGTFGGGWGLARIERKMLSRKKKSAEVVAVEEKDPYARDSDDPFQCGVWEIRWFEQRLVDEKSLSVSGMTTCDDAHCINCKPTRVAKVKVEKFEQRQREQLEKRKAEREQKAAIKRACEQRERRIAEKQAEYKRRLDEHQGRVEIDGKWFIRPVGVPEYAFGKVLYDTNTMADFIHWSWIDHKSGKMMGCRSTYFEVEEIIPIHDPVTNDLLDELKEMNERMTFFYAEDKNMARRRRVNALGYG